MHSVLCRSFLDLNSAKISWSQTPTFTRFWRSSEKCSSHILNASSILPALTNTTFMKNTNAGSFRIVVQIDGRITSFVSLSFTKRWHALKYIKLASDWSRGDFWILKVIERIAWKSPLHVSLWVQNFCFNLSGPLIRTFHCLESVFAPNPYVIYSSSILSSVVWWSAVLPFSLRTSVRMLSGYLVIVALIRNYGRLSIGTIVLFVAPTWFFAL